MEPELKKIVTGVAVALTCLVGLAFIGGAAASNDPNTIMVVQTPVTGSLHFYTQPGMQLAYWGRVTKYPKREQFWFSSNKDQGGEADGSLPIRFNDGAQAKLSGSLSWEMPEDVAHLTSIHCKYGSPQAVEQQLIRTTMQRAIQTTGPLMSSTESYAERKNELLADIKDQVEDGIFDTITVASKIKDPMTGQERTVNIVKVAVKGGKPIHVEDSPLKEFGISTYNLALNDIHYPEAIEKQIALQQQSVVGVSIAIAEAKKAEQAAITAAKQGEAEAAKAKWAQEVEKATEVTAAEKARDVSALAVQTATNDKKAAVLRGEGEAAARKLIMASDGGLDKKLATYEAVNGKFADAIKGYQGNWVPNFVFGGSGASKAGSGAEQLIDMLSAKTAKELSLDMRVPNTGGKTK